MAKREGEFVDEQNVFQARGRKDKVTDRVLGKAEVLPAPQRHKEKCQLRCHPYGSHSQVTFLSPVVPGARPYLIPLYADLVYIHAKNGAGAGSEEICLHPLRGF